MTDNGKNMMIVFGGTTEGRKICEFCTANAFSVYYCAATEEGAYAAGHLSGVKVHTGRLDADGMAALFREVQPILIVDATHPYAVEVSANIDKAAGSRQINQIKIPLIRVKREIMNEQEQDCDYFNNINDLLDFLEKKPGNIFVTTGSSLAKDFTRLTDYRERIWMRILPAMESLRICLEAGCRPERIICMQAPFSEELNRAMFRNAGARILVTKNSGAVGGFTEKIAAAKSLGMSIAVWSKPIETEGITLEEVYRYIREFRGIK